MPKSLKIKFCICINEITIYIDIMKEPAKFEYYLFQPVLTQSLAGSLSVRAFLFKGLNDATQ